MMLKKQILFSYKFPRKLCVKDYYHTIHPPSQNSTIYLNT